MKVSAVHPVENRFPNMHSQNEANKTIFVSKMFIIHATHWRQYVKLIFFLTSSQMFMGMLVSVTNLLFYSETTRRGMYNVHVHVHVHVYLFAFHDEHSQLNQTFFSKRMSSSNGRYSNFNKPNCFPTSEDRQWQHERHVICSPHIDRNTRCHL